MLALRLFVATVLAAACNAIATGGSGAVTVGKQHGIVCSFGQPINSTTFTLSNGAKVLSWGCEQSAAETADRGQDENDFKLGTYDARGLSESVSENTLTKRQYDACGVSCTTYCKGPAGGGPDPNHCSQLAEGWTADTFDLEQGLTWNFWFASCRVRIANRQPSGTLKYCWSDLRGVTNYIAWNCQATQNAHGGYCFMNDGWNIGSIDVNAYSA